MILNSLLLVDFGNLTADVSLLSSLAVIIGAIFVAVQLTQNNRLIKTAAEDSRANLIQTKLTNEQLKQNRELANMDLIMRLYEFANTAEVQSAWLTVMDSKISSFSDFQQLSKSEQVAFYQIGALFESLGVLVERGIVTQDIIEDMFLTELAWRSMKPFVDGMREKYGPDDSYSSFEKLYVRLTST